MSRSAFNSAVETGVRSVAILTALYPKAADLQRLVYFDYLTLHSRDVGGPESLHAELPLRSGELAVRRKMIEEGLLLMLHRGLVGLEARQDGFFYCALDASAAFLSMVGTPYMTRLITRTHWVINEFGDSSLHDLMSLEHRLISEWSIHFESIHGDLIQ